MKCFIPCLLLLPVLSSCNEVNNKPPHYSPPAPKTPRVEIHRFNERLHVHPEQMERSGPQVHVHQQNRRLPDPIVVIPRQTRSSAHPNNHGHISNSEDNHEHRSNSEVEVITHPSEGHVLQHQSTVLQPIPTKNRGHSHSQRIITNNVEEHN